MADDGYAMSQVASVTVTAGGAPLVKLGFTVRRAEGAVGIPIFRSSILRKFFFSDSKRF